MNTCPRCGIEVTESAILCDACFDIVMAENVEEFLKERKQKE